MSKNFFMIFETGDIVLESEMKINSITSSTQPNIKKRNKRKVTAAAIAGSAIGIAGAVAGVYSMAKKGNPAASLSHLSYSEKDALLIGAGSVIGGLTGGMLADDNKENITPKLREASQQFVGNMVFPLGTLAIGNKLLEKTQFKLPQINSSSKPAKIVNGVLSVLPKVVVTVAALMGGMEAGNKVMNKVNNKIFKEEVKHDVKAEDYLVHADDICLTANMLLKDAKAISAITSKALPLSFIVSGAKTGMQQKDA